MKTCPYCERTLSGDICSTHGFVGAPKKDVGGVVPPGGIIMWSGSSATVPQGWALCDGSNGTPNLRDRFIVGAGASYGSGATGGNNADHSHSVPGLGFSGSGSATGNISSENLSAHSLSANVAIGNHDAHAHGVNLTSDAASADTHTFLAGTVAGDHTYTQTIHTHGVNGNVNSTTVTAHSVTTQPAFSNHNAHGHTFSSGSSSVSGTTSGGTSGGASIGTNMPAFYALAFIMRVQ
jgi:hypothetical protein